MSFQTYHLLNYLQFNKQERLGLMEIANFRVLILFYLFLKKEQNLSNVF